MAPRLLGLDHFVLTVRDIEATADWYVRVLGMRRHDSTDAAGRYRTALYFTSGAGRWHKINLHKTGNEITPHAQAATPGSADWCFTMDTGGEPITAHLANCGVTVELGPVYRAGAMGGLTSVYVRDPDGNLIELAEGDLSRWAQLSAWDNEETK